MKTGRPRTKTGVGSPTVRISAETHEKLHRVAGERDLSAAWLADKLLSESLDNLGPIRLTTRD